MTNFQNFELNNAEMIFGGEHIPSTWTEDSGRTGKDIIDTTAGTIVYY